MLEVVTFLAIRSSGHLLIFDFLIKVFLKEHRWVTDRLFPAFTVTVRDNVPCTHFSINTSRVVSRKHRHAETDVD